MRLQRLKMAVAAAATLGVSVAAVAQTPFAGEDFDGGTTNGGFTATTMVFTPDNSVTPENPDKTPGTFGTNGSFFDRFGIVGRDDVPNDVNDDSVSIFPADMQGFIPEGKADNFVLSVDTENGQNASGDVAAEWTFDISGRSNLSLAMDFGMIGDFEGADFYNFTYSIDGGTPAPAFSISGLDGQFYSYTLDNGTFFDRTASGFFDDTEWEDVTDNGPTPGIFEYHIRDDGTGDDVAAQDGLVPVTFAGDVVEQVRGYRVINSNGTFDQEEFGPIKDPLGITTGDGTLVDAQITADLATYTTALEGTGSTLTLTLNGNSNGGNEYFVFDNIVLSEEAVTSIPGDFDMDGDVDIIDFGVFADNFGGVGPIGDFDVDGDVDIIDFGTFADNFGTVASSVAVPEPTSLAILAVTAGLFAARRKR